MKKTIALLPVDARPVTYDLPKDLAKIANWNLLIPEKRDLGFMKSRANIDKVFSWLEQVMPKVDGIIVSVDMLLYGGLVPSRINDEALEVIEGRLAKFIELKEVHPQVKIMAFSSTMRLSNSYVDEEEKEYWSSYGKEIWKYSFYSHKYERQGDQKAREIAEELEQKIPADILADYLETRKRHFSMNQKLIYYLEKGLFDSLVFPQDDTSEYGLNIREQEQLYKIRNEKQLFNKMLIYPGADEVASVLTARMIYALEGEKLPRFYPIYSGTSGVKSIARYEDRPLEQSVTGQIDALGSHTVESPKEADILFGVNVPGNKQGDHALQEDMDKVDTNARNISEWLKKLNFYKGENKLIAIADVAYANGADPVMVPQLLQAFEPHELAGYAGWNTAGNTIGTVVAHSALVHLAGQNGYDYEAEHEKQITLRLLDDYLYQAIVRPRIRKQVPDEKEQDRLLDTLHKEFIPAAEELLSSIDSSVKLERVCLPWDRTFEIEIFLK